MENPKSEDLNQSSTHKEDSKENPFVKIQREKKNEMLASWQRDYERYEYLKGKISQVNQEDREGLQREMTNLLKDLKDRVDEMQRLFPEIYDRVQKL